MAEDILFSMGIEGADDVTATINRVVNSVNAAFANIQMPNLNFGNTNAAVPRIDPSNFNLATASVSELQRELGRLQRQFTQGADTTNIVAVRSRLQELRIEMGAINGQGFVQRLTAAFSESLSNATNWQQRMIEIAGGNIIANLFEKVGEGVINAGKYAITSAGQFESLRASLNVIAGSDGVGGKLFDQFQKLASKSPFNFDDVGEQGTKLLAMGIPIADVTDRLSRIGDVAAGVGREKLPSIVYAYGQIKSQGKAMAGDLSQFINAGVPIIEVLAETLKKPQEEIKHLASTGKISFKDIDTALLAMTDTGGKFFEMMKTQSNTFEGLWSSMEDSFQLFAASIGTQALPIVKNIVIAITDTVNGITDFINGNNDLDKSSSTFGKIAKIVGQIATVIGSSVFSTFGSVLSYIADNALALSLIVGGLTLAFKANAIIVGIDTAAVVLNNLVNTAGLAIKVFVLSGLVALESAWLALTASENLATAAAAAFWLISNPVGWAILAGGIIAATGAYLLFNKESAKSAQQSKVVGDLTQGLIDKYKDERIKIDGLFGILNSNKAREKQIQGAKDALSAMGDLLPKYNIEKDLINESEKSVKDKNEAQKLAAHEIIESYGKLLPAYITEQSLLAQTAQGELDREEAQKIIRRERLNAIAKEFFAEQQLKIARESMDLEIERQVNRQKNINAYAKGGLDEVQRRLENMVNGTTNNDFDKKEADAKIKAGIIQTESEKIIETTAKLLDGIDWGAGFDKAELGGKKSAAAVGVAAGSLKDLQDKLKLTKDVLDAVNPSSDSFVNAAQKAKQLEDKIKAINDRLTLMGLNSNSIAGLQARLSIISDTLNKSDPNAMGFNDLIAKSVEFNEKIKLIQDRIKLFSLPQGSLESLNFQLSQVNIELGKQSSGSPLIAGLIVQSKDLEAQIKSLKIELGQAPPLNSLAGLNNSLSELQKKFSETNDITLAPTLAAQIVDLEKKIRAASGEMMILKLIAEGKMGADRSIKPISPIDYSKYVQDLGKVISEAKALKKEIDDLEKGANLTVNELLSLESKKAQLKKLEETLPGGYDKVNPQFTLPENIQSTVPTPIVAPIGIDKLKSDLNEAAFAYADFFDMTSKQTEEFGAKMQTIFTQIQNAIESGVSNGIGNAAFAFGEGIGNMIMGLGTFQDAVVGSLFAVGQAFLVEIPKAIGMFLIQTAVGMMVESLGVALPVALPILLVGLGLVAGSGVASGILGGLQKKRQKEKEGKKEIPNVNQAFGGNNLNQNSNATGLSNQSGDKPVLTNVINITMPVYGIDGLIIGQLQQQQIIQQELH